MPIDDIFGVRKQWTDLPYPGGKLNVTKLDDGIYNLIFFFDNDYSVDISIRGKSVLHAGFPTNYQILREGIIEYVKEALNGIEDIELDGEAILEALEKENIDRQAIVKLYKYYHD